MPEQNGLHSIWDRLVDRLWPATFSVGILMTFAVIVFLAFSFWVVFGAAAAIVLDPETSGWLQEH